MSVYLIPIEAAIFIFPILAAFITIPYIIKQYRTYGSILPLRIAIVYTFIFYLLCCYFLVTLPFPPIEEVAKYTTPTMQLIPFESLREFSVQTSLVWSDPLTYLSALNEPSMFTILFNIFMVVPFGIYLRYYFRFNWKKTLGLSFLLSLSFELLQLSALFGYYPRPYRLFDVDDLITNSLGGMLGFAITPLLTHFLPTRSQLDKKSYTNGLKVSSTRRVFAVFIDMFIVLMTCFCAIFLLLSAHITITNERLYFIYVLAIIFYFFFVPLVAGGRTFGKATVRIKLQQINGNRVTWYQHIPHFFFLYIIVLPAPYLFFKFVALIVDTRTNLAYVYIALTIILCMMYVITLYQCVHCLFKKDKQPWFIRISNIHNVSTIVVEEEEKVDEHLSVEIDEMNSEILEVVAKEVSDAST